MSNEQIRVRKFYKEFLSWKADSVGLWIAAGVMEVLFVIMMLIPYQEMAYDIGFAALPLLFGYMGAALYLMPYISFIEAGQRHSIYERIKYLPVDRREIQKMRVIKLVLFVVKIFPVIFVCQLFFAYFGFGEIRVSNVVYAVLAGLVCPIVCNLPYAWFGK